jgi:hypothetical protein
MGHVEVARMLTTLLRERGTTLGDMRPLLDGDEVRQLRGAADGPEIGAILRKLIEGQIQGTIRTRHDAIAFVRRFAGGGTR